MQVARATTNQPHDPSSEADPLRSNPSYAPLYLTTSLSDIAFDIEELEAISLDRLKLLKAAEAARAAASLGPQHGSVRDTIRTAIRAAERAHHLNIPPLGNPDREEKVLRDEASHFLLRLALCKTQEHRTWLLQTEHDLFSSRLDGAGADFALKAIEKARGPSVKLVSASELELFRAQLDAVARGPNRQKGDIGTRYFKIAFEEVPSLVRNRRVFLHKGMAYVPERNILDVVSTQFRSKLSEALAVASKAVSAADSDRRMRPILESIRQRFAADDDANKGFDPSKGVERISLGQLNESRLAMPLCMTNMMSKLREQHHLRHSARMQLGVFLKGCGLTMEESLQFWRSEFGKGQINSEKFEKTYAYNIRHHYGREGKRRNLTPFACMRIINDRPGPGEHNGCPYREFEEGRLKTALRSTGTDPNAIPAIVAKARQGNFQVACGMCFALSQPGHHPMGEYGFPEFIPSHPNEYFIEARRRRFGPAPVEPLIDSDIDDEDMLQAAEAVESQNSAPHTPAKKTEVKEDKAEQLAVEQQTGNADGGQDVEMANAEENDISKTEEKPKADDAEKVEDAQRASPTKTTTGTTKSTTDSASVNDTDATMESPKREEGALEVATEQGQSP